MADPGRPEVSRVYDWLLGGSHNFAADRELGHELVAVMPALPALARANRAFLHRAVRFLVGRGIRQFLDLGSGLPTAGGVHEVVWRRDPGARVVYVDIDPVAVAYAREQLAGDGRAGAVCADLREPGRVLAHPVTRGLLDLSEPVGLLTVAVLHFVSDAEDLFRLLAACREALAVGSCWVLSHATADGVANGVAGGGLAAAAALVDRTSTPLICRTRRQIGALLDGFDLVRPGLVRVPYWRHEPGGTGDDAGLVDRAFPAYAAAGWIHGRAAIRGP